MKVDVSCCLPGLYGRSLASGSERHCAQSSDLETGTRIPGYVLGIPRPCPTILPVDTGTREAITQEYRKFKSICERCNWRRWKDELNGPGESMMQPWLSTAEYCVCIDMLQNTDSHVCEVRWIRMCGRKIWDA